MITHNTVHQLLDVFRIIQNSHVKGLPISHSYQNAVKNVAKQNGVTYQTIGDGCRRRLRLKNISELYSLLNNWTNGDPNGLAEQLIKISPSNIHSEIKDFFYNYQFDKNRTTSEALIEHNELKTQEFCFNLSEKDARILKAIAEIEGVSISETVSALVSRSLRVRIKELAHDM